MKNKKHNNKDLKKLPKDETTFYLVVSDCEIVCETNSKLLAKNLCFGSRRLIKCKELKLPERFKYL